MILSNAFSQSLSDAELESIFSALAKQPEAEQIRAVRSMLSSTNTAADKDIKRKRSERSEAARIEIPECRDPIRRERALAEPELFLRTYFAEKYSLRFGKEHKYIIQSVVDIAARGGRQAIAAPRGRGKSEIVKGLLVYAVTRQLSRFILPIAATTDLAKALYQDFRRRIGLNELLMEDFPEICWPVRCLEGAPQRAGKQHIDGKLTQVVWTDDYLSLPHVPGSPYGGVKMSYYGLDSAFRGANIDGDRPDFVLIDDPETAESARSIPQIETRESILDRDIAGLASQTGKLSIAVLTTVQKIYSLSAKLTDPKIKPAWNGKRFGLIETWPINLELWDEYIAVRRANQEAGDTFAMGATQFYIANREAMDAGVSMVTDHVNQLTTDDGRAAVLSPIQEAYNKIADTSLSAFKTEYQNDPDPEEQPETTGLTAGRVASRISGFLQGAYHPDTETVTVGLDIGKYYSHWCKIAWHGNAIGLIVDYGVMETPGMMTATDAQAVMTALLPALQQWRTDITADGKLDFCLIDSGDYGDAVYEFVRQVGGTPFAASKGWDSGRFRMPKESTHDKRPFQDCYAAHQPAERVWLYHVHTEHWKQWLQERFVTATFNESQQFNDGTLSLYSAPNDRKRHTSFAHHMIAEERRDTFVPGKGIVRKWVTISKNNHYLDAVALACAAAGCLGVRIVPKTDSRPVSQQIRQAPKPRIVNPYGQPFLATERK
jgi:hypothetical protein